MLKMKHSFIIAGLLAITGFLALLPVSCTGRGGRLRQDKNEVRELRVLEWNVWHRGHSEAFGERACEGTREILRKSEADIILMVETYGCSDEIADCLGYYHRLLSDNLSIYSRYPIVRTYLFPDSISTFNFGGAEIDVNGRRVRVFDVWLHYLPDMRLVPTEKTEEEILAWDDAGTRDDEIRRILSVLGPFIAESDSIPVIMGGDFNDYSHLDWTDETRNLYGHGGAVVGWTVSKAMEQAGFRDSFREVNPDPVQDPGATWLWDTDDEPTRMDRIDFIYYMGAGLQAEESEIYNAGLSDTLDFMGEKFFYASDHGFVMTTFSLE